MSRNPSYVMTNQAFNSVELGLKGETWIMGLPFVYSSQMMGRVVGL